MLPHQPSSRISDPRFDTFLSTAGGRHPEALALYHWHAEASGARLQTIHRFEVFVRNAIDARLRLGQPETPTTSTWLHDPAVRHPGGIEIAERIERRLRREGCPSNAGLRRHVLAPMTCIHLCRNRIAHHDSLLGQSIPYRLTDMIDIAADAEPHAAIWIHNPVPIPAVLSRRP